MHNSTHAIQRFRRAGLACLLGGLTCILPGSMTVSATAENIFPVQEAPFLWRAPASDEVRSARDLSPAAFRITVLDQAEEKALQLIQARVETALPLRQTARPSLTERLAEAVRPVQSADAATPPAEAARPPVSYKPAAVPARQEPAPPDVFRNGTLGQMVQMRAELEQLKMQVTLEEMRAKLQDLRNRSFAPGAVGAPPSLDYPPIGQPSSATQGQPRSGLHLVSIQSVNGRYSATLGTPQGTQVVRVNDYVSGARVVSISKDRVVVNRGVGNSTLTIQE